MTAATAGQPGGNMEGKETRFGISASALFATVTTDASCGAVNSMHDSYTPIGGAVPLINMMCDETIFGGVGAGLYGMLMYAVIAVFIAGLMVGRTPEYIGKKIEKFEVRMAILAVLILFANVVFFTALASNANLPREDSVRPEQGAELMASARWNHVNNSSPGLFTTALRTTTSTTPGAHGFSEILYAYARRSATTAPPSPGSPATLPTTTRPSGSRC